MPFIRSKAMRSVFGWQLISTCAIAAIAALWVGTGGAVSAALGGIVNLSAVAAYALAVSMSRVESAGAILRSMFRAEALKIALIVVQLGIILTVYKSIVVAAFIPAFVATALAFGAAFTVRD